MVYPVSFLKMSGAGNDFIVLAEALAPPESERARWVRRVCERGVSVGADGVVLVAAPRAELPTRVRFYNADGGEADFCGNGLRCAARFLALLGGSPQLSLVTRWGTMRAEVDGAMVRVELPDVVAEPRSVAAAAPELDGEAYELSVGVPHLTVLVADPAAIDVASVGRRLRWDPRFGAEGTNVNFVAQDGKSPVAIRSFERGVEAETLACGSGAVASALVLHRARGAASPVGLLTRSGSMLVVNFAARPQGGYGVALSGEAREVYRGELLEDQSGGK